MSGLFADDLGLGDSQTHATGRFSSTLIADLRQ